MSSDPALPEAASPASPLEATLLRRCPYCRDDLSQKGEGEGTSVLCAECATPHHAECFSEHGSCAIRGCKSLKALNLDDPSLRRICPACQGQSPDDAPFCAWCSEALGERGGRPPGSLRRFLRAAVLLLSTSVFMGGFFGYQQSETTKHLVYTWKHQVKQDELNWARSRLRELARAQRIYAREDLDGNGKADLAQSLKLLKQAIRPHGERLGLEEEFWTEPGTVRDAYTFGILPGGKGFVALPQTEGYAHTEFGAFPRLEINLEGKIK